MYSQWFGSIRSRSCWILLVLVCYAPNVSRTRLAIADEPANAGDVQQDLQTLIENLNSPAFATREAASKRLLEIGAPALDTLRRAKQNSSFEVRERASRICEEIDKSIFENVTKKFILAADGSQSFGLPAWDVFRSISGDSRTSKLLFITMLRNQSELAKAVEVAANARGTEKVSEAYEQLMTRATASAERLRVRLARGELPTVGDTVGLLLACSLFDDTVEVASASSEVNEMVVASLYRASLGDYFSKPGYDRCLRAFAGQWISKTQASLATDVLQIAHQRNIPEGAIVARRHLDGSNDRETRVRALQCLARFGNEGDIPAVAKLLNEELIVYEFNDQSLIGTARDGIQEENLPPPGLKPRLPIRDDRKMIVRLNDVALAVCMKLGSEDVTAVFPKYDPNDATGFVLVDFAFPAEGQENHRLAIARWKKEHPQYAGENN